ncbi:glycosyltransferase, partial [Treponema sp. OttesenSCG-928-L16]|nr:glycosyltransferase [Treponema sp. OttesenSCG-928-L16]
MRVALVHYHLRRGGVTSVVHHQAKALSEAGDEVLIITGEANPDRHGIAQAVVGELQYDRLGDEDRESVLWRAEILARKIYAAMEDHWGAAADIVHVHNPLIQKNAALIPALNILNKRGQKLLLQNHDLAEDFRPDMYVGNADYPADCHYGVINSRDFSFLHRAGLKAEGLHLIPNEVVTRHAQDGLPRTRYLYPVRAIRRKNIGEALLLSLFIPEGCTVALTLPPTTERDEKVYRFWQEFAVEHKLPVEFALGLDSGLPELLGTSLCIISSSVKEGFGFSFLEPWTAGRAVIGRRIEYVCRDFEENGIRFDALYS